MSEIHEHGYWNADTAHTHHVHSPELAKWIADWLDSKITKNTRIYDFACGLGNYLQYLSSRGYKNVTGYEGDPPKNKVWEGIIKQDLTIPFSVETKGVCIFLEVEEHIPSDLCDFAVQNVINACDKYLIMSWAIRGQEGFGHVNCLNNDEVIEKFQKLGFKFLNEDSESARSIITDKTYWFKNTIMIFEKI